MQIGSTTIAETFQIEICLSECQSVGLLGEIE